MVEEPLKIDDGAETLMEKALKEMRKDEPELEKLENLGGDAQL